jgi:hypothetical protein
MPCPQFPSSTLTRLGEPLRRVLGRLTTYQVKDRARTVAEGLLFCDTV